MVEGVGGTVSVIFVCRVPKVQACQDIRKASKRQGNLNTFDTTKFQEQYKYTFNKLLII